MDQPPQTDVNGGARPFAAVPLVTGYVVWCAITVTNAFVFHDEPWEAVAQCWLPAFLAGTLAMLILLAAGTLRRRISAPQFLATAGAGVLPVSLLVLGWNVVCDIYRYPDRIQAFNATVPVVMVLVSGLGLIFGWVLHRKRGSDFLAGAAIPPAAMAVASLVYFGFGVFSSDDFRYRDAFSFDLLSAAHEGDALKAECLFILRKPGDYVYTVGPLVDEMGESRGFPGVLVWAGGKTAPTSPGEYRVTLVWRRALSPDEPKGVSPLLADETVAGLTPNFGISRREGSREQIIRTFPVPINGVVRPGGKQKGVTDPQTLRSITPLCEPGSRLAGDLPL
jgi:hypothetical protein